MPFAIHWFRKGLRLHDNPALLEAIAHGKGHVLPLFILDPWFLKPSKIGAVRLDFFLKTLAGLDEELSKLGSRLVVARGSPTDVLRALMESKEVTRLTWESDCEPYAKERDATIVELASELEVPTTMHATHTLWDLDVLLSKAGGKAPLTMTSFRKLVKQVGPPKAPVDAPKEIPELPSLDSFSDAFEHKLGAPTLKDLVAEGLKYDVDQLKVNSLKPGEAEGLKRLKAYLAQTTKVLEFEKPKTKPTALTTGIETTALSPYLKTGSLSVRYFYCELMKVYKKGKKHTEPPVSLLGQLYWREFYYLVGATTPNYDKMKGNAICKQIPWDTNDAAKELLHRWEMGQTGFPAIDAAMNQLRAEGWMHHLARHLVACFLTRGDLWVSWEYGRDVFDKYLIDADWSLNNGNWMWLSASAFFSAYFRVYSPIAFFKKSDKSGAYIRKYVPELKNFPDKYIYQPWEAPKDVQRKAGCIIGKDYPMPIVDHSEVSKANMGKMKRAYAAAKGMDLDDDAKGDDKPKAKGKSKRAKDDSDSSSRKKAKSTKKRGAEGNMDAFVKRSQKKAKD